MIRRISSALAEQRMPVLNVNSIDFVAQPFSTLSSTEDTLEEYSNKDALVSYVRGTHVAPVFETPPALEQAMSRLQQVQVDNPKRFRQLGKHLIQSIKMRTLSKHRGGIQPNYFDEKSRLDMLRGSRRQQEKQALKALTNDLFRESWLTDENIEDIVRSHPSYDVLKAQSDRAAYQYQTRKLGPRVYNGLGALAYATSRLPSTYAAIRNVFHRLKISRRDDGWAPASMLDFGAGPGTAAWAAHSVWNPAGMQVTAVEISSSMANIGYEILKDVQESSAKPHGKDGSLQTRESAGINHMNIRWMPFLPRDTKRMKRYDICLAAYSLNEIDDKVERNRLLNSLLHSCQEYIVLIEPGTPHGFATIEESKQHILKVSKKLGIPFHVASPCPHDGPCPLIDARAWCHFGQKHVRTDEQRIAVKSLTGKAPQDIYNEKFSYVILKRGPRKRVGAEKVTMLEKKSDQQSELDDKVAATTDGLLDPSYQEDMIKRIPNSRVLRARKRKGHVMLDLCSVLDENGSFMGDDRGTILRQVVSKGKGKSFSDIGSMYKASKVVSQGDEWPLLYQVGSHATETPLVYSGRHFPDSAEEDTDENESDLIDDEEWEELVKIAERHHTE